MHYIIIFITFFLLIGCKETKERIPLIQLCEKHSMICEDLNDWKKDDKCKDERVELIYARKTELDLPSDKNRFSLIQHFEKYASCIERAAGIEHKKYVEKKSQRLQGLLTAYNELERLKNETQNAELPELLFWHGTRHKNEEFLKRYLEQKDSKEYNTAEHQIRLAFYYSKYEHQNAINHYLQALKLSQKNNAYDPIIFLGLASNYNALKNYKEGYYFAYLLKLLNLVTMNNADIYKEEERYSKIDFNAIEEKALVDYETLYKDKILKSGLFL